MALNENETKAYEMKKKIKSMNICVSALLSAVTCLASG